MALFFLNCKTLHRILILERKCISVLLRKCPYLPLPLIKVPKFEISALAVHQRINIVCVCTHAHMCTQTRTKCVALLTINLDSHILLPNMRYTCDFFIMHVIWTKSVEFPGCLHGILYIISDQSFSIENFNKGIFNSYFKYCMYCQLYFKNIYCSINTC